jgi:chorismate mutase
MIETKKTADEDAGFGLLRAKIDGYDRQIIKLLARRFKLIKEIGIYKASHNLPILDTRREKELLSTRREQAFGVRIELVENIFKIILDESHRIQEELRKGYIGKHNA